ncbi:hypothetical protein GCM10010466_29260 [Planomonospora alba]|uniref:Uncharacterized protein n=1 Tax=Planomonospora alba TaxID=161354 RepID=A0ABP6N5C3_9ACTN
MIPGWLADVVPIVRAGQQQEARWAVDLIDQVTRETRGRPAPVVDLSRVRGRVNGVPLEDVYTRPFHRVWTDLSEGRNYRDAVEATADRLGRAIEADLQLAARDALSVAMESDPEIIGYKRVLSARPNHCGLCEIASTNTYSRGDLLPIHPSCACSVRPIYEGGEGSDFLDRQVASAYARALAEGRISVSDHEEYGPYLQAA